MRTERVEYRGITFTRYPDVSRRHHRVYFWPSKAYRGRGVKALHVEIYLAEVCAIPDGWHVHHVNGDPLDNRPENLAALPAGEHSALHVEANGGWGAFDSEHMARLRELAKEWHASPEGRAWHAEHGRASWIGRERVSAGVCCGCGAEIESFYPDREGRRWCSRRCFARSAYREGAYAVEKVCAECGEPFMAKHKRRLYCSRRCSAFARERAKRRLQPDGR